MKTAILFLILLFLINIIFGFGFKFYRFFYFDIVLHFLGGFFVAMFSYQYLKEFLTIKNPNNKLKKILIIVSASLFFGVIWEFLEYISTILFKEALKEKYGITCCIGNLDDTLNDLLMDTLGGITFSFLLFSSKSKIQNKLAKERGG